MALDNTTKSATTFDFDASPSGAMRAFVGGYPWAVKNTLPAIEADIADINACGVFANIADREAYLLWVVQYKRLINAAEVYIRAQKSKRKDPERRYSAQANAVSIGQYVTLAIHLRRLGKRWSAGQRDAAS